MAAYVERAKFVQQGAGEAGRGVNGRRGGNRKGCVSRESGMNREGGASRERGGRRSTIRGRRRTVRGWLRSPRAARCAAYAVAPWLLLAACGGADDAALPELEVNPVEAMMAIDDVRVAGMPLSGRAPAEPRTQAGGVMPAAAPAAGGPAAWPQIAHLQPGAPLDVDMVVADATVGSEVAVVWSAPDGREVWRRKQAVGDGPRLAFSADTTGWPAGLYRGAIHYGRVPVHHFAVQVGAPPAPTFGGERLAGQPPDAGGDGAPLASRSTSPSGSPAPTAGGEAVVAGEGTAASAPSAPRAEAAQPASAAPVERVPSEAVPAEVVPAEGVPVERIPDEDPNVVVPEGPPGPAPEPDADDAADDDDDPPPAGPP